MQVVQLPSEMNKIMDFPLDLPSTRLPFGASVIKLEPLSQLSEAEDVEERDPALYRHSSDIVQKLTRSLSLCSPPLPPLTTSAPEQVEKETNTAMANSSPGVCTGESSTQEEASGEQQLQLSDIAESAVEIQPATVEVFESRHSSSSSSDTLNLPPNSTVGKDMTQVVGSKINEAEIQPPIVEVYATVCTNQPQIILSSHNVGRDQGIGKEGERVSKESLPTGDQVGGIAIHTVSSLADIEGGDYSPDSSQIQSEQPGPKRNLDSDVLYSSDSQSPSLKMIRLESPSPSPDSPLSLPIAQTDTQSQQQDLEPCHSTKESTLSLLVAQMDAQSPCQQYPKHPDTMESSPLSQLVAEMDAQPSLWQQDPERQNITEENGRMECSTSGGFHYSPLPDSGEKEGEREMEGERGRIEPPVVGREREESHNKAGGGDSRVSERERVGDGHVQLSMFARSGGYKQKLTAGLWVKGNDAASRRGEGSSSRGQGSKFVDSATEQLSTSSGQRGRDHALHHSGDNLDEGAVLDEHGTLEVDVVDTASQLATLEVDVEGSYSFADELETAGAALLRNGPRTQVVQPSGKG